MKKHLLTAGLLLISTLAFSQVTRTRTEDFKYPHPDTSATPNLQMAAYKASLEQAYIAYNEGDWKQTRFHLNKTEEGGWTNAAFYYLLGQLFYDQNDLRLAERYWTRGYEKKGCQECQELVLQIKTTQGRK